MDFSQPPVPKARPPIRNFRESKEVLLTNNMHKIEHHKYLDVANKETVYTDDDDDNDENEDDSNDDSDRANESQNEVAQSFLQESFYSARNSPATANLHMRYFHSPNTSRSFDTTNNSSFSSQQFQKQPERALFTSCNMLLIISIAVVIFIILALYNGADEKIVTKVDKSNVINLNKVDKMLDRWMGILQTQFDSQKTNIWNDISSGIREAVLNPKKPTVIILFGNDVDAMNCLAQFFGQISGIILGSNDYLTLLPEDFTNDIGQTIYNLKIQILQKRVVVVKDLLSINREAIKAFHNFCDREKPLVEHAVYIITVLVDGYKPSQKELEFIEQHLNKKLLDKIEKDILDPLITRLTDGVVVPILPESSINFDYVNCSVPIFHEL